MNIVLATDDNFVQHCCVTITSLLVNNKDVCIYLFTEGLSAENEMLLSDQTEKLGGELRVCKIDSSIVKRFPMPPNGGEHISIATYYRLFVAEILPPDIDKVIYMDCDMVVRKSFNPLWKTDLSNYAIGAVFQSMGNSQTRDKIRLMMPAKYGYFNAGLLLINLKYWRDNDVTNTLLSFIRDHYDVIKQHDQDVLNACLYDKVRPISYTWNFLPMFFQEGLQFQDYINYHDKIKDPANIHFVSVPKPWDFGCSNLYKDEYYKYLSMTPFKEFKPTFVWGKYWKSVVKVKLVYLIGKVDIFRIRKFLIRKS